MVHDKDEIYDEPIGSLEDYALKSELPSHANKSLLDKIDQDLAKASAVEFSFVTATDFVLTETIGGATATQSVKDFMGKFNLMFELDSNGNIKAKKNFYSTGSVASYVDGNGGELLNEVLWTDRKSVV